MRKCKTCYNQYQVIYRQDRRKQDKKYDATLKLQNRLCDAKRRELGKNREYEQSTPRVWLSHKLSNASKDAKRRGIKLDIDLNYLCRLWASQNGHCKLTKIPMSTEFSSHYSASIDRIIPKRGYTKGNIQLVCKAMNLAKHNLSQDRTYKLIEDIVKYNS